MEAEWSIRCRLLLLDTKLLANVHVVHHQLVGRVDDTPTNLILSSINLVIFPSEGEVLQQLTLQNLPSLSPAVLLNGPRWPQ